MTRPTLIDLKPIELNYYQFMVSLDKCNRSSNAADDLSAKICVPSGAKDVNVIVINMITRIKEPKTLVKHISRHCKCKVDSTTCASD